jgi:hypothetical protein
LKKNLLQIRERSKNERIVKIVGDLPAQCHKILASRFEEPVDPKAVIALRHLAT